jgi:hypothetical protein
LGFFARVFRATTTLFATPTLTSDHYVVPLVFFAITCWVDKHWERKKERKKEVETAIFGDLCNTTSERQGAGSLL